MYPALERVPSELFGICVVGTTAPSRSGRRRVEFSIMSVSKPFVFALVCEALGADEVREPVGVNATGLPFNSVEALERSADGPTNPMVNPGAIATTSLAPGGSADEKWEFVCDGLSRVRGPDALVDDEVYALRVGEQPPQPRSPGFSRATAGSRCRPGRGARPLHAAVLVEGDAHDLAVMGATLADGGVNPITGERVIDADRLPAHARRDDDGRALRDLGRLDLRHRPARQERDRRRHRHGLAWQGRAGDVRPAARCRRQQRSGQLVARFLSRRLGLDLFVSSPASP